MAEAITCDLCVIGAGSGGLSVAAGASQLGASVVLIEQGRMGGECLNTGCVPSKALLAAAARGADFAQAHVHVRAVIDEIAPQDSVERFEGLGVRVIREHARFSGPRTVLAGDRTIRARRFVLATGSQPAVPPVPGLDQVPYLTNETIFDARPEPEHLIVLGAGPAGIELAQAFGRLGAPVSVVDRDRLLARDDPELTSVIGTRLREEGVEIIEHAEVRRAERSEHGVALICASGGQERRLEGSHLLIAAGRKVNVADLDLEKAGVAVGADGVSVDSRLRTANHRIYAVGDVTGPHRLTHAAAYQAGIVLRNALFRIPAKADYRALPWVTYTDPELAHVGMNEAQARQALDDIRVLRWPFCENDRAVAEGRDEGFIKVITTPRGRIVGASIVGAHAGELIHPWTLAVGRRLKIGALTRTITPYPTFAEVSTRVAGSFFMPKLFTPRVRRMVQLLARLG